MSESDTLEKVIGKLSTGSLMDLYRDSLTLDRTGVLSGNAPLRNLTKTFFGDEEATVLKMVIVSREIYKTLASDYIKVLEFAKRLDETVTVIEEKYHV